MRGPGRPSKLDAHRGIVGVLTDAAVAAIAGMTPEGVRQFRRRHGIEAGALAAVPDGAPSRSDERVPGPPPPPSEPTPAAEAPAPIAPPVAAPEPVPEIAESAPSPVSTASAPTRLYAFRVVVQTGDQTHRFIAVGEHIGAAAMVAVRVLATREGGPWAIRGIKAVEEVLA